MSVAEDFKPESEQEEKAKLEWLRAAAREGFDDIEQGDYSVVISDVDITALLRPIYDEVKAEFRIE